MTQSTLDALKGRDYTLILDKSSSMEEKDCPGGQSRWADARERTIGMARKLAELDPDGITVITFAGSFNRYDGVDGDKVKQIFQENEPNGSTVLAPPLQNVFDAYLKNKKAGTSKPHGEMLLVVTDGAPQDEEKVASAIVNFTKKLDSREEFGIQFVQIGKDASASRFLKFLDDNLEGRGAKFDIVDTKTAEETESLQFTEVLLAALND